MTAAAPGPRRRARHPSLLAILVLLVVARGVAGADPATTSSLPWRVRGSGPVGVAGGTIYAAGRDSRFGYQGLRAVPLSNAVVGFSVFSTAEAVGEPVTGAPNGTFTTAVISDGANGWYLAGGYPRFVVHMRADGTIDPAFDVQLTNDIGPGSIRALALKDSRVVIGGDLLFLFDLVVGRGSLNAESFVVVALSHGRFLPG